MERDQKISLSATGADAMLPLRKKIATATAVIAFLASAFCAHMASQARAHEHAYREAAPYRIGSNTAPSVVTVQTNRSSYCVSGIAFA